MDYKPEHIGIIQEIVNACRRNNKLGVGILVEGLNQKALEEVVDGGVVEILKIDEGISQNQAFFTKYGSDEAERLYFKNIIK